MRFKTTNTNKSVTYWHWQALLALHAESNRHTNAMTATQEIAATENTLKRHHE